MVTVVFRITERCGPAPYKETWRAAVPVRVCGGELGEDPEQRSLLTMVETLARRFVSDRELGAELGRASAEFQVMAAVAVGLAGWQTAEGLIYSDKHQMGSEVTRATVYVEEELSVLNRARVAGHNEPRRRPRLSSTLERRRAAPPGSLGGEMMERPKILGDRRGRAARKTDPAETRQIVSGDLLSAEVLRDFLVSALRHDAVRDELTELLVFSLRGGWADSEALGGNLRRLLLETIDAAEPGDWEAAAALHLADARDLFENEGAARFDGGPIDLGICRVT